MIREFRAMVVLCACMATFAAAAQTFPTKPIRLVVPYPPGGGTDATARVLALSAGASLGQPIVVENRPGASGMLGTDLAAAAPADGYTLLMFADTNTIIPSLSANVKSDPVKSFQPIAQVAIGPLVIFANPGLPVDSLTAMVRMAKEKPGSLSYASSGNGSAQHLAMERLKLEAGITIEHVPYKGGGQAVIDVMGGSVPIGILGLSAVIPHIRAGKLKALAITDSTRSSLLPDVPTVAEALLPGFEAVQWFGIVAPAGTPAPIVAQLHAEFTKALRDPEVARRLADLGLKTTPERSPVEFARFIERDYARWPPIIRAVGVKID